MKPEQLEILLQEGEGTMLEYKESKCPWHTLLRQSLEQADYRAFFAEMEGQRSVRVSEPSAVYDVTKMTQRRLFD